MKRLNELVLIFLVLLLAGCSAFIPMQITPDNLKTSVLCKEVGQTTDPGSWDPRGITNVFTLEGKVFHYSVFTWTDIEREGGRHKINYKWYTNGNVAAKTEAKVFFGKSPSVTWGSVPTITLGVGKHYVEFYVDNLLMDRKEFEIKEK